MKIILVSFFFVVSSAHAFNWTKCQSSQPVTGNPNSFFAALSTTVANTMVQSSQFTSSWGDCALIGSNERIRKIFIAQNLPFLLQDMAKGSGEYLEAYASLHRCSDAGKKSYGREMKERYFDVSDADLESVYFLMEAPFKDLKDACPLT